MCSFDSKRATVWKLVLEKTAVNIEKIVDEVGKGTEMEQLGPEKTEDI